MKRFNYILMMAAVPLAVFGQSPGGITPREKRMESLDLARDLLTTNPSKETAEEIAAKNPFSPKQVIIEPVPGEEQAPVSSSGGASDREVLAAVIDTITPSGIMQMGDVPFLLFGQKKLKVGDRIPIEFQGADYQLQITAIERTTFTLRLNKEEITRSIKPASTSPKP